MRAEDIELDAAVNQADGAGIARPGYVGAPLAGAIPVSRALHVTRGPPVVTTPVAARARRFVRHCSEGIFTAVFLSLLQSYRAYPCRSLLSRPNPVLDRCYHRLVSHSDLHAHARQRDKRSTRK